MTAETVGQPRGSALALAARTRKPWQRRMESTRGRSPQGRATATVMRQSVHASHVLSARPGNFSLLLRLFSAAWLADNDYSDKDNRQKDEQQRGRAGITCQEAPGQKLICWTPCVFFFSSFFPCNDGSCRLAKEVQTVNLENLVLYCVGVNSPHLKQPGQCCFTGRLFPGL